MLECIRWIHHLNESKLTSNQSQVELYYIVGLFVEVQFVCADAGVLASLVEVSFHHLQKGDAI